MYKKIKTLFKINIIKIDSLWRCCLCAARYDDGRAFTMIFKKLFETAFEDDDDADAVHDGHDAHMKLNIK